MNDQQLKKIIAEEVSKPPITSESVIYCDMDGVLVDFASGAIDLANSIISGVYGTEFVQRSKSMRRALREIEPGFKVRSSADLDIPEVRTIMFAAIGFNPGAFFGNLPPLEDGISTLWPFLIASSNRVSLLTAPVENRKGMLAPTAGDGKKAWAKEWLSPAPADVIISPARNKPSYAGSDGIAHILIDDKASTIREWNKVGYGILHITGDSASTIARLKELL